MGAKIKYQFKSEYGDFTTCDPQSEGICDAFVFQSIRFGEDGGRQQIIANVDGRNGGAPLPADELFKCWVHMANSLVEDLPDGGRKDLCNYVFSMMRNAVMSARAQDKNLPSSMKSIECLDCGRLDYVPVHGCDQETVE